MKRRILLLLVVLFGTGCAAPLPFFQQVLPTATAPWVSAPTVEITLTPFSPGASSLTATPSATATTTLSILPSATVPASPTRTFTPSSLPSFTFTPTLLPSLTPTHTTRPPSPTPTLVRSFTPTKTTNPANPTPTATTSGGGGTCLVLNDGYVSSLITLMNNERASNGLAALAVNSSLVANAQAWSETMATTDTFVHSGQPVGENIAAGYGSPAATVAAWMASPGHRDNILNPEYTQVGGGYAYCGTSTYGHYWTAQFLP